MMSGLAIVKVLVCVVLHFEFVAVYGCEGR